MQHPAVEVAVIGAGNIGLAVAYYLAMRHGVRHLAVYDQNDQNDQNDLDGNAILGPGADGLGNFHLMAGFSGHGLMHAPGCGLALAELLLHGRYTTIDLTRSGWQRVAQAQPLPERGII